MRRLAGGRQMTDVWRLPAIAPWEKTCGKHPTQKPLALVVRAILTCTRRGGTVLDPFAGSARRASRPTLSDGASSESSGKTPICGSLPRAESRWSASARRGDGRSPTCARCRPFRAEARRTRKTVCEFDCEERNTFESRTFVWVDVNVVLDRIAVRERGFRLLLRREWRDGPSGNLT